MNKNIKVGYTTGVFDMFHIGHLNLLKRAREQCDYLIVGVSTDELVNEYKNKDTIIPFEERMEIIKSIKYVDKVVAQTNMNKLEAYTEFNFNIVFVGSDWKNTDKWNEYEKQFAKNDIKVVYLPYTTHISSSKLRKVLENK